ncbi:MAG: TetR/AcrR family transcriptional regulator [Leptospirales bacterium]
MRILETASKLFYLHGIANIGINEVIEKSGVARMSLYHHFSSKDVLILAVLDHLSVQRVQSISNALSGCHTPESRLLAIFQILQESVQKTGFRGCAFINAAIERAKPGDPVHKKVADHKEMIQNTFLEFAREAGVVNPDHLARQLMILWDGAMTQSYIRQDPEFVSCALDAARILISSSLQERPENS